MLKNLERILQILILRHRKEPVELDTLSKQWRVHLKTARRLDRLATEVTSLFSRMGVSLRF
jgi:hypothetical protein